MEIWRYFWTFREYQPSDCDELKIIKVSLIILLLRGFYLLSPFEPDYALWLFEHCAALFETSSTSRLSDHWYMESLVAMLVVQLLTGWPQGQSLWLQGEGQGSGGSTLSDFQPSLPMYEACSEVVLDLLDHINPKLISPDKENKRIPRLPNTQTQILSKMQWLFF